MTDTVSLLRNAVADLRLLPVLRAMPIGVIEQRTTAAAVASEVEEVLGHGGFTARGWQVQHVEPGLSDAVLVRVGPPGKEAEAVVKIATSVPGADAVSREAANLTALDQDPRLEGWRDVVPAIYAAGALPQSGVRYLVTSIARGMEGRRLLRRRSARAPLLNAAAETISGLHDATGDLVTLDADTLARYVDRPLAVLGRHLMPDGLGWRGAALEHVGAQVREELAGARFTLAWTHGDFVPSNLFASSDAAAVTGIVDWERGRPDGLAVIDLVHLVLATRAIARRREFGQIVSELVLGGRLDPDEGRVLERAADGRLPALVLLAWLDHVSGLLEKSGRYMQSRVWLRLNVDHVLREVARW